MGSERGSTMLAYLFRDREASVVTAPNRDLQVGLSFKAVLLVAWAFLFSLSPVWAEPTYDVHVVTENYPPYNYEQADSIAGLSTDIVRQVLDRAGLSYKIELMPWSRAYGLATDESRKNVLIYTIARTAERETKFQWLVQLSAGEGALIGRMEASPLPSRQELLTGDYKAVCVFDDAGCETLEALGFTGDRLHKVPDNEFGSEIKLVDAGRADFFIAHPAYLPHRLKQLGLPAEKFRKVISVNTGSGYYLAASKSTEKRVVEVITQACRELRQEGLALEFQLSL